MREIKFRAWYTEDEPPLMFEQVRERDRLLFQMAKDHNLAYEFATPWIDDDWILERYTGRHDRNGKEIFEGDIVEQIVTYDGKEQRSNRAPVECIDVGFWWWGNYGSIQDALTCFPVEVIGNTHENPELLEEQ